MLGFHKKYALVVDAGNTNLVFALANGGQILHEYRSETNVRATADDLAVWLMALMQHDAIFFKQIQRAVIASVVPDLDYALRSFARKYLSVEPLFISAAMPLPFQILLPMPEQLGADRIANAAAVHAAHYPLPAIVIDLGTATTFDVLDASGHYIGGVIAPGPAASLRALSDATAKLPQVRLTRPAAVLGTDTVGAMQSGVFWGYVGLINGIVSQLQSELGPARSIIATGGLANLFKDEIAGLTAVDVSMTLRGALSLQAATLGR